MDIVAVCAIIVTVMVHELGHAITGKKLGVRIENISLFGIGPLIISWRSSFFNGARMGFGPLPYGAYVSFDASDMRKLGTTELDDISFAGPHMNFVVGVLVGCVCMFAYGVTTSILVLTCIGTALTLRPVKILVLYCVLPFAALYVLGYMLMPESLSKSVNDGFYGVVEMSKFFNFHNFFKRFLSILTYFNVALGLANMLPIFPLDGGHVAKRFAERTFDKRKLPYKLLFIYLPSIFVILLLLPVVGDVRKIISLLF